MVTLNILIIFLSSSSSVYLIPWILTVHSFFDRTYNWPIVLDCFMFMLKKAYSLTGFDTGRQQGLTGFDNGLQRGKYFSTKFGHGQL